MLLSHLASFGAAILFLSTTVGCAAEASSSSDDAVSSDSALTADAFKLYSELGSSPSPRCDVHTALSIAPAPEGDVRNPLPRGTMVFATLREAVDGACKIRVDAEARAYRLLLDSTDCGSKIYKATATVEGASRAITLTDHRTRMCKDIVPALVIVDEVSADGTVRTFYSSDAGRTPAPKS